MALAPVQTASKTATASPVTVTLGTDNPGGPSPGPTTAGNCLVVCIAGSATTTNPSVTGITLGGAAGNFAQVFTVGSPSVDALTTSQWEDQDCAGGQTALSVAFTMSGSGAVCVTVMEWPGIIPTSPVDKTATQLNDSNVSSWSSSATAATTQPVEVAVGCVGAVLVGGIGTISGPSSPWTNLAQQTSGGGSIGLVAGYQVLSSTGTVTYSGTQSLAAAYAAGVATFFAPPPVAGRVRLLQAVKRAAHY